MTHPTPQAPPTPAPVACYRHPDRPTYIRCVRCDRPICPDCMRAASVGFQCPEEGSAPKVRTISSGGMSGVMQGLRRTAPVTFWLIVANAAVFVAEVASGASLLSSGGSSTVVYHLQQVSITLQYPGGHVIPGVAEGQYWRLLTSMFVHYGLLHIALNMYSLVILGSALEGRLGRSRYLALYLLAGLGGSVLSYLFIDPASPSAGASGAIFGLFGAYAVAARRERLPMGPILGLLAVNVAISFLPGIGLLAHFGGLAVGAALAVVVEYAPRRVVAPATVGAFVVVAVLLVGLTAARTHQLQQRNGPLGASGPVAGGVGAQVSPGVPGAAPPPARG